MSVVPKSYPREFREDVVRVARDRDPKTTLEQVANDFGVHFTTLSGCELAADGVPVPVACRVLDLARPPYYRWLAKPVGDAELARAYRADALLDAHRDDPEFGYRFLADEARQAGEAMCDRTAWRICSELGWFAAFGKKRGRNAKKPGPPVHDDLCARVDDKGQVRHEFAADARTGCGRRTSPSTAPARASSTSARSKTRIPTGSWATRSIRA